MIISKIRSMLNDSDVGRRINDSRLGLYVEAISRTISDGIIHWRYEKASLYFEIGTLQMIKRGENITKIN